MKRKPMGGQFERRPLTQSLKVASGRREQAQRYYERYTRMMLAQIVRPMSFDDMAADLGMPFLHNDRGRLN